MKTTHCTALALILVLFGSPQGSYAEAPAQLKESPAVAPSPGDAPSKSAPNPAPSTDVFGLSLTQIWILVAVAVAFIFTAILMRWWLSEPAAEEAEGPPTQDPQDAPP